MCYWRRYSIGNNSLCICFRLQRRSLKLHEIVEELEKDEGPIPDSVIIFPPENHSADITDEDSGDENQVLLDNLPGSQLRAQAEIHYGSSDSEEEDNLPLHQLSKRQRLDGGNTSSVQQQLQVPISSTPTVSEPRVVVDKNKIYTWSSRDIHPTQETWKDRHSTTLKQTPLYYFECLFDSTIISLFVKYTNLYATKNNNVGNVTDDEIKCFLGILLFSGYVVVPRRHMYWENAYDCGMPIVYNAMSRDRFSFIMSNLHCCDNDNLQANDKFAKIRPLLDALSVIFLDFAPFEENHSIDEAMVPYYGGHPCKQFIRGKPIRWGYKFWVGATRLGYVIWFEPYQGQSGEDLSQYRKLGLGASVILQYSDVLRKIDAQAHFHLFFDNFFTSIPLIDELGQRNFKATGTIRENRVSRCPLPSNKEMKKSERGSYQYKSSRAEEIVVCKWHDNSVVTVASNAAKVMPTNKIKRFSQKEKKHVKVNQPAIIKTYNENMGGVDRSDQNIGLYRTSIRGKKWYFSLISHCLDMALHNAWQLYRANKGEHDHLKFRRSVATGILETYKKDQRKSGRTSGAFHESSRYDGIGHIIKYREGQLRCSFCHKHANFFCKKCNVTLHPKNCFEQYHNIPM